MDKYEKLLLDIEEILLTCKEVATVNHGRVPMIEEISKFTHVTIAPSIDGFELFKSGKGIDSYDNRIFVRLVIQTDCSKDDLHWVRVRREIMDAILKDQDIWAGIVDRDITNIAYDDFGNYPLRSFEMLFEFRMREECVV